MLQLVGNLSIGSNISKFDFIAQDPLIDKVIMHLDVLSSASMEHKVLGQLHIVDVVAVHRDRSQHLDPEVVQQSSRSNGFTSRDGGASPRY